MLYPRYFRRESGRSFTAVRKAFTLIELLVVIAVMSLLMGILIPALSSVRRSSICLKCQCQMRQIGLATLLYADDHDGYLPRSTHSALAHREKPWGYALCPCLSAGIYTNPGPAWENLFNGLYRCPIDRRRENRWSYGKNVYPELTSAETGGPIWPRLHCIPRPAATVIYGELLSNSAIDHFMAHFWASGGLPVDVDKTRHDKGSNYVFLDGHVEKRKFEETWDPCNNIDGWNPAKAQ